MHPQTYGFEAFVPGDEIEFVNHVNLLAYATNRVKAVQSKSDKEILLTLEQPAPEKIGDHDVDRKRHLDTVGHRPPLPHFGGLLPWFSPDHATAGPGGEQYVREDNHVGDPDLR